MDMHVAIEDYLACKKNRLTHDSYHWYQWMLGQFEAWCTMQNVTDLAQITPTLVQQFVAGDSTFSDNTKHHRAQTVKGFLRWCSLDEDTGVKEKTVRRIEMPRVEETEVELYTEAEIKRLLEACEKTRDPLRNRALLLLLLDTGIRAAELCYDGNRPEEQTGLLFEHVVFGSCEAEAYITVMGKGRKTRTVKMGETTCQAIREYLCHERPRTASPYVFLTRRKKGPFAVRGLQNLFVRLGALAQVNNAHAHRFRHTFAINQLLAGTSAFVLMRLMGHTSLEATKTYTRALSQMQARQASVSIVDLLWNNVCPLQDEQGHKENKKGKQRSEQTIEPFSQEDLLVIPRKSEDPQEACQPWIALFSAWQERRPDARLTTSAVAKTLSDVLPDTLHQKEGEHPKAFLYRLRTALHEHIGIAYGENLMMLQCWAAVKRGMHLWQVYQAPPAR